LPTNDDNPLLSGERLPAFSRIRPEHIVPAVDELLAQARSTVARLTEANGAQTWESIAQPLEDLDDLLNRTWSPIGHLHAVADNPKLREAFNICLPKLSAYATEVGQNGGLYRGYETIAGSEGFAALDQAQRKAVQNALRDFRLSGVGLEPTAKDRYKFIAARLAELSAKFSENVLDATQAWTKHVTDPTALRGLPPTTLGFARETAEREKLPGWLLEAPSYVPVITYADEGALRQEMYTASTTRASDQGPNAGQWENTEVMAEILMLRHEKARLLGFGNYAEYSLATKMARSAAEVVAFLQDLAARTRPIAERELDELRDYARVEHGVTELRIWDIAYYSEKLRERRFSVTQEQLRPYFPVPQVLHGLFAVVNRLYGLRIEPRHGIDVWDPEVQFFTIRDSASELRGEFYLDLYSRPHKRGGAWMDECVVRKRSGSSVQTPVAYLTCNFTPHPRRGHYPVPRVRSRAPPSAHSRRLSERVRHQRRGVGRDRASEPDHGELVLGERDPGVDLPPPPDRRTPAR
jgi:oligopeptidase A